MNRPHRLAALCAALMFPLILAGCSDDSPVEANANAMDDRYFQQVVAGGDRETRDLFTSDIEALDESPEFQAKAAAFGKEAGVAGPITPEKFGRRITKVSRSLIRPSTMQGDSVAIVHTQTVIEGEFVVKAETPTGDITVRKPFVEVLHRDLRFERVWYMDDDDDDDHDDDEKDDKDDDDLFKWKLVAASIVNGGTEAGGPVIVSVELVTPNFTYTVTDPDTYFMAAKHPWKIKMPKLKDAPITLRVTVLGGGPDAETVVLHHLESDKGLRKKVFTLASESESGGQFTRVYEQTWFSKIKLKKKYGHLVVSVLSHASTHDDDPALYASTIWGIPYLPSE